VGLSTQSKVLGFPSPPLISIKYLQYEAESDLINFFENEAKSFITFDGEINSDVCVNNRARGAPLEEFKRLSSPIRGFLALQTTAKVPYDLNTKSKAERKT
jgi:hypothetical protein